MDIIYMDEHIFKILNSLYPSPKVDELKQIIKARNHNYYNEATVLNGILDELREILGVPDKGDIIKHARKIMAKIDDGDGDSPTSSPPQAERLPNTSAPNYKPWRNAPKPEYMDG